MEKSRQLVKEVQYYNQNTQLIQLMAVYQSDGSCEALHFFILIKNKLIRLPPASVVRWACKFALSGRKS
jgi:hypothetical protein